VVSRCSAPDGGNDGITSRSARGRASRQRKPAVPPVRRPDRDDSYELTDEDREWARQAVRPAATDRPAARHPRPAAEQTPLTRDSRQSATPPLSMSRDAFHVSREDSRCAAGPRAQSAYRLLLAGRRSKSYVAHGCPGVPGNRSRW